MKNVASEFLPTEGCSVQKWPDQLLSSGQEAHNNVVLEGSPTVLCLYIIVTLFLPLAPEEFLKNSCAFLTWLPSGQH